VQRTTRRGRRQGPVLVDPDLSGGLAVAPSVTTIDEDRTFRLSQSKSAY
jgi:hypothetical protein